jgi:hypothetical protein
MKGSASERRVLPFCGMLKYGIVAFGALLTELFRSRQVGFLFRSHVHPFLYFLLSAYRTDEFPLGSIEPIRCLRVSLAMIGR